HRRAPGRITPKSLNQIYNRHGIIFGKPVGLRGEGSGNPNGAALLLSYAALRATTRVGRNFMSEARNARNPDGRLRGRGDSAQPTDPPSGEAPSVVPAAPDEDEAAHGRHASTPSDIPARGWKDILKRCYQRLNDDRILAIAAGVTFYALLAIFPAIAALVAVYGLFARPGPTAQHPDDNSPQRPRGATRGRPPPL